MRVTFAEVAVKATKRWRDEAGRQRQETRKFWQTVNPFNKNADGSVKTYEQVRAEVIAERDLWLLEPAALTPTEGSKT